MTVKALTPYNPPKGFQLVYEKEEEPVGSYYFHNRHYQGPITKAGAAKGWDYRALQVREKYDSETGELLTQNLIWKNRSHRVPSVYDQYRTTFVMTDSYRKRNPLRYGK